MNKRFIFLLLTFTGLFCRAYGQETSNNSGNTVKKEEDPTFAFGNISPVILGRGGIEASTVQDLTSYWVTSKYGSRIVDRFRISRFDSNLNLQVGLDDNKRWDIGVQLKYGRIRLDENSRNSPFKVFAAADAFSTAFNGVSAAGIRVRTTPFKNNQAFTFQGSCLVPLLKDKDTRAALNADRVQTDLAGTYFVSLNKSNDLYLYAQGRYTLLISNQENNKSNHFPGISVLLVKSFLDQTLFVFPGLSYIGSYQQNYAGGRLNKQGDFVFASLGAQVSITSGFTIFANTQRPWIYRSGVNIYSDLVKNSYSDWALGLRLVL